MMFLTMLLIGFSFMGVLMLSTKIADWHYKTYKGEQPLHILYGMAAGIIWAAIGLQIIFYFESQF
jgi:hypothetical protein